MDKKLKIVVAGEWNADIYEKAIASAFSELGNTVIPFRIASFFKNVIGTGGNGRKTGIAKAIWYKIQYKYIKGPTISRINKAFLQLIQQEKPDIVFIYRGNYFFPATIRKIKSLGAGRVFVYNNDDPFGIKHPSYLWKYFINGLAGYDHIFCYREKNIQDCRALGFNNTSLLRSYYRKEENFPLENITDNRYKKSVCFIGHYEDDGRDDTLRYLIENGVPLKLYGTLWERSKHYLFFLEYMQDQILPLYQDYNLCINSSLICLVFLSRLNNDTYTRRCFEIPATGTFMLSVYTDDLNSLFKEGVEAEYFRDKEELLSKTVYYLTHQEEREKIAQGGYARLLSDGHEVIDRARQILHTYYTTF